MPTDLLHRIGIAAPAETIYRAVAKSFFLAGRETNRFFRRRGGESQISPALKGESETPYVVSYI
jgi:hypothetical protein